MKQLIITLVTKYYKNEQIKEDETSDLAGKGDVRNM